jgi:DNA-binding MarR family transcriptional regulator
MDFIKDLGMLGIASRLKRLAERLMRGGSEAYKSQNIDFDPKWFATFYLLNSVPTPMTISDIANALQISHPAVIQTTQKLIEKGLIESFQDEVDRRKRRLTITEKGRNLAIILQPVWDDFVIATAELFQTIQVDMLGILEKIEGELDKEDIGKRIIKHIKERQYNTVEILDFDPKYKEHFKKLNYEWLEENFEVEELDERMLSNPEKEILQKGGYIFFARVDGQIVGTTALLKIDERTFEIAKMAVTERARGRQVGRKLTEAVIERAKLEGAKTIILKTDNKLRAAINLYRKMGFKATRWESTISDHYYREKFGITMKLDLT